MIGGAGASRSTSLHMLVLVLLLDVTRASAQSTLEAEPPPDASDLPRAASTWKGAIVESFRLLVIEHSTRIALQDKTRRELAGTVSMTTVDR